MSTFLEDTAVRSQQGFVLFVDDYEGFRTAISRHLQSLEVTHFLVAESVSEARQKLSTHPVAMIICDLIMPGESSVDFLVETRKADPSIGCMLLTGQIGDLTHEQRVLLEQNDISIEDKSSVSGEWIRQIFGLEVDVLDDLESLEVPKDQLYDPALGRDIYAEQRLLIDSLRSKIVSLESDRATDSLREELLAAAKSLFQGWLHATTAEDEHGRLWINDRSLSLEQLSQEVETETELGKLFLLEFIEDMKSDLKEADRGGEDG